jgi:hypothetical protein
MLTDVSEVGTAETSVNIYLTTRQYIPEHSTRRRENLKSHISVVSDLKCAERGANTYFTIVFILHPLCNYGKFEAWTRAVTEQLSAC